MGDQFAVNPEGLFPVGIANIIHLDHLLDANPFPLLHLERLIVDKAIPPGLSARRTAAHLTPVGVVVPGPSFAEWLDSRPK